MNKTLTSLFSFNTISDIFPELSNNRCIDSSSRLTRGTFLIYWIENTHMMNRLTIFPKCLCIERMNNLQFIIFVELYSTILHFYVSEEQEMLIKILENPTEQSSGVVTDVYFNTIILLDIIINTNLIFSEYIVLLSKPMMREIKTSKNN